METLWLFLATLASVLAIGVEMRALAKGNVWLAVFCAVVIALGQTVVFKTLPNSPGWDGAAAYALANAIGIWLSFIVHKKATQGVFKEPFPFCDGVNVCPLDGKSECTGEESSCKGWKVLREKDCQGHNPCPRCDGKDGNA